MQPFIDALFLRDVAKPVNIALVYGLGTLVLSKLLESRPSV